MAAPELDDATLRRALQEEPLPQSPPERRRHAISQAVAVFDAEYEKNSQGSVVQDRPSSSVRKILNLMGAWNMNQRTLGLAASAALALFVVVGGLIEPQFGTLAVPEAEDQLQGVAVAPPKGSADSPRDRSAQVMSAPAPVTESATGGGKVIDSLEREVDGDDAHLAKAKEERAVLADLQPGRVVTGEDKKGVRQDGPVGDGTLRESKPAVPHAEPPMATSQTAQAMKGRSVTTGLASAVVPAAPAKHDLALLQPPAEEGRDRFTPFEENPVKVAKVEPVSTFSADVDTASYSFVRKTLNQGRLPPPDAVRVEEMVNYFHYDYPTPRERSEPFATSVALYPTPWKPETRLLQIGIKGFELSGAKPPLHLTFLVDVSGSMSAPDKLPLLKQSLGLLVNSLAPEDSVALVVYAGAAGSVLDPTPVKERSRILAALNKLEAGGSTAGGAGIELAYSLARASFDPQGVNRVIIATDGDFNVGVADPRVLKGLVEEQRRSGIYLSVLGFGQGNYHDALMQELAQNGNGVAAYIDTLAEARKVLVEEVTANLFPIAKDVKIQVEFNPARVAEYRLIGYETRRLAREDFKNDQVDAGEVGAGHTVTALYEVTPVGSPATLVEPLRYGREAAVGDSEEPATEWAFVKIRYKLPEENTSRLLTQPVTDRDVVSGLEKLSVDHRFAAAVAAFGERLRGGRHLGGFGFDGIIELAQNAKGDDPYGYRAEFVNLVRMAKVAAER